MNKLNKNDFKKEILNRILKIKKEIAELKELTKPIAPDCAIGRVSRMDAINNRSVNIAALENKESKYKALKIIVDEIDLPTFGKCVVCGGEIPLGRVLIVPESKRCIYCANK
jgi:DnaK suppressor protein